MGLVTDSSVFLPAHVARDCGIVDRRDGGVHDVGAVGTKAFIGSLGPSIYIAVDDDMGDSVILHHTSMDRG